MLVRLLLISGDVFLGWVIESEHGDGAVASDRDGVISFELEVYLLSVA